MGWTEWHTWPNSGVRIMLSVCLSHRNTNIRLRLLYVLGGGSSSASHKLMAFPLCAPYNEGSNAVLPQSGQKIPAQHCQTQLLGSWDELFHYIGLMAYIRHIQWIRASALSGPRDQKIPGFPLFLMCQSSPMFFNSKQALLTTVLTSLQAATMLGFSKSKRYTEMN